MTSIDGHFSFRDTKKEQKSNRYNFLRERSHPNKILLLRAPYLISANENGEVEILKDHSIYIEDNAIREVFRPGGEEKALIEADLVYDAGARGGIVLTPGFINVHAHPTMYLMRSAMLLDYGQHLDETIAKMPIWQKHIKGRSLYISVLGDITEQQKGGITTTVNHNAVFKEADEAAEASGERLVNCVSVISNSEPDITFKTAEDYFFSKKREMSSGGMAIHYLFKVDEPLLRQVADFQQKHNTLLTIHFAESSGVAEECVRRFGMRETKLLDKFGLLNERTLLSHVLHVTSKEIQRLVEAKVGIAHLPTSNSIHKSGVFNYPEFASFGGADRIALGTDSVVSKNRLDLLTEAFQTRITHLPDFTVYYEDLFKMMTVNGARVLGEEKLGRIAPGYKADIAFWKLRDRGFIPFDENDPKTLVGNIISHGGRNIRDLMINGKFVISNRVHNFVNETELLDDIQAAHMEVRALVEAEKEM